MSEVGQYLTLCAAIADLRYRWIALRDQQTRTRSSVLIELTECIMHSAHTVAFFAVCC